MNVEKPNLIKDNKDKFLKFEPHKKMLILASFLGSFSSGIGFFIINVSAQDSVRKFKKQDYTASFGLTLMASAIISIVIVSRFFAKTKHSVKIVISTLTRAIGFFLIIIAYNL